MFKKNEPDLIYRPYGIVCVIKEKRCGLEETYFTKFINYANKYFKEMVEEKGIWNVCINYTASYIIEYPKVPICVPITQAGVKFLADIVEQIDVKFS